MLLAESESLRWQMEARVSDLQTSLAWMDTGYSLWKSFRSWWPLAAAAAGLALGRGGGGLVSKLGKAWSFWRLVKKVIAAWPRKQEPAVAPDR